MKLTHKMRMEIFHLLFLQQFSSQTAANLYAIKGGCNLRFFFDSARYSEDLDIDVSTIQKQTLENKVNKILYHLLHIAPHAKLSIIKNTKEKAIEALQSISFADYKSQVVNFLESDKQKIFDGKDYWETMTNNVHCYLNESEK